MVKLFLAKQWLEMLEMLELNYLRLSYKEVDVLRKVSIILPVRNEEHTISDCICSLLNNTYQHIEIVVVDGMSSDRTVQIVKKYVEEFGEKVKLIQNPSILTSAGLNLGILNSTGEYIMIASGHSRYSKDYIDKCVDAIEKDECDVAGGIMEVIPRNSTNKAVAISIVLKHPFGVGGAKYRTGVQKKIYIDTVAYGIYKREIFEKVGLFDEKLIRNQDIEFNLRLRKMGYQAMLIPQVLSYYYARDSYKKFWENNFSNGFWVTYSMKFVKESFRLRHLIPLFFILYLLFFFISFFALKKFLLLIVSIPAILYLTLNIYFSIVTSYKKKSIECGLFVFLSFIILHVSYGLGSLIGILKLLLRK